MVWLYTHFQCLFFVRILACGYKCGYNYLFLLINNIDISLLGMKFESGLRTIKYRANKKPPRGGFFVPGICLPQLPTHFTLY
ncbi:hypothetical protein BSQ79_18445 [Serratia marcescens]|nr:hypothetical protein BSQ79_18445 [Serratia marcescens]PZQ35820.1 MAG: hypothetical protein DI557_01205 [Serratia marcescens]